MVFEARSKVGGISRTESHQGYRFDIGGHRFFTKVPEVEEMWHEVLPTIHHGPAAQPHLLSRQVLHLSAEARATRSRNIGLYESMRIMLSYFKWQLLRRPKEESFEEWVINRFGGRLYMHFFRSYTEKVWGIDPQGDPRRLGGAADQEPVAVQGGLERVHRRQRHRQPDRGVPISAARPRA